MKKMIFILIVLCRLSTPNLWADGVEVSLIEGNTVIPVRNNHVQMVSEEVRMFEDVEVRKISHPVFSLLSEKAELSKGMKVIATFLFENLTDNPINMKMGFPLGRGEKPTDFKAYIQKELVKVDKRAMGGKGETVLKDSGGFVLEMYVWDISFAANEKKVVKVEYYGEWGSPIDGKPYTYFIYVTKTGALWSGTIGKADFYLELPKFVAQVLADKKYNFKLNAKPSGYIRKDDHIEWHFKEWEPKENVGVALVEDDEGIKAFKELLRASEGFEVLTSKEAADEQKAIQKIIEYFKNKTYDGDRRYYTSSDIEKWKELSSAADEVFQRLYIKALRNEIYARYGRIFNTQEMRQIFQSASWYKRKPAFKESELNETEKKNIEFIFEYEKKMGWQ